MQPVHNTSIVACSSPQSITGAGKRVRGLTWDLRRPSQSTAPKGWTIRTQSALPGMCNIFLFVQILYLLCGLSGWCLYSGCFSSKGDLSCFVLHGGERKGLVLSSKPERV